MKKILIWTGGIIVLAISASFLLKAGVYPFATVNGEIVTQKDFEMSYAAAMRYYEAAVKTYGRAPENFDSDSFLIELKRSTLGALIDEALIKQGLILAFGESESNKRVEEALAKASSTEAIAEEVQTLYGIDLATFTKIVLVPAAEREIIIRALKDEGISFTTWILDARSSAKVNIFLTGFEWKEGRVEIVK